MRDDSGRNGLLPRAVHVTVFASLVLLLGACTSGRPGAGSSLSDEGDRENIHVGGPRQPNIVFILNDDLGWGDVGYHGSDIRTPNLDRLAARGVELNRYYTFAVCSPTRAALMTGRSALETGVDGPIGLQETLPLDAKLLPQYLRDVGYQTKLVGKWHLGRARSEYLPFNRGFDYYYGFLSGFIDHYTHLTPSGQLDWQRNGISIREEGHTTDLLTEDAIRQIRSRNKSRPLFLYVAYDAPHTPLQAPAEYLNKYAHVPDLHRRTYSAMVEHQDAQLARLLATIEAEGMSESTLIVWASDNGPQGGGGGSSGGLRGMKGTSFEGGQRVPAIAYWPGRLEGGRKLESAVTVLDWFPTLLTLAGGAVPDDPRITGRDVTSILQGAPQTSGIRMVLGNRSARIPDYYESAYRWPWKLVRIPTLLLGPSRATPEQGTPTPPYAKTVMLFDVMSDPDERNDVAALHPEVVQKLAADLESQPRAPRSLSEWSAVDRVTGLVRPVAGGNLEDRPPGGGDAMTVFTVEKGEPLAEAAARASREGALR